MLLRGVRTHLVLVAVIGQYIRVFQVILVLDERVVESSWGRHGAKGAPPLWWRSQDWRGLKERLGLGTMRQGQTLWRDVRSSLVKVQALKSQHTGDARTMGQPSRDSSTGGVELARACEMKCACCKWGSWRSGAAPGRPRLNPRYSAMSYKIWFMILKFALVLFKLYLIPPCWSMKVFSLFWLVGLVLFLVLFCFLW